MLLLKRYIKFFIGWLRHMWPTKKAAISSAFVEDLPEQLSDNTLYVVGENDHLYFAALKCPCGCGEVLSISLFPDGGPRWILQRNSDGTVSLTPSVWRRTGCRSHFFLVRSEIRWCE